MAVPPSSPPIIPRVSVIIPTYNSGAYLAEAIASVMAQRGIGYEVIVVDDGSTDDTPAILAQSQRRWGDRLRSIRQANAGSAAARNQGVAIAQGDLIAFLDADDRFLDPDKLADQAAYLDACDHLGAVHTGWQLQDRRGRAIAAIEPWHQAPNLTLNTWLYWKPIRLSALVLRRIWLDEVGGFDVRLRQSHDVDLILRLTLAGCRSVWLRRITTAYRQHPHNTTRNATVQAASVETWLDRCFARSDLPAATRAIEPEVRYSTYVWLAWIHYQAGNDAAMEDYLRRSLDHAPGWPVEAIGDWPVLFARFAADAGTPFTPHALFAQPQWQALLAEVLARQEQAWS